MDDGQKLGLLSFSRRSGEALVIRTADGDRIELWFEVRRGDVRVLTVAPKRVRIDRGENLGVPQYRDRNGKRMAE